MHSRWKLLAVSVAVLGLGTLIACTGSVGVADGTLFAELTVAGKTFTITLGDGGIFNVRKGAAPIKKGVRVENLFEVDLPPKDRPSTAQVTVLPSNVKVSQLDLANKAHAPLQAITGSFDVVVYIGSSSMSDPCEEGTRVGTFHITASGGAVTLDRTALDLPQAALSEVITGYFTLCFEVSGDADATVTISGLGFAFGADESAQTTAQFTFRNDDSENIHFLLPGQTFPENRVSPGQTATDSMSNVQIGDSITVRCGRNGVVLDSTSCPTVTGTDYQATVVWDGFHVTCEAEQSDGGGGIIQVPIDRNGDAVDATHTINGVDYSYRGALLEDNSDDAPIPGLLLWIEVDLAELGLQYVETVYLAPQSAWSFDLPNGVQVATVTCDYEEGGPSTTLDLVMGSNIAEWAWENPCVADHFGTTPPHSMPTPLFTNPTTQNCDREYDGHTYGVSIRPDMSRTLAFIALELVDPNTLLSSRLPENSEPTWLGAAIMAITLEGPAGTPTIGPHQDECTFDSDCDPGEECVDGECEVEDGAAGGTVSSTFDTDNEAWYVVGDAEGGGGEADYVASGGNPGGHVHADDDAAGGTWYWQAPNKFYGDFSSAYGQTLSYDIRQSSTSGQFDWYEIILDGGGITIVYDYGTYAEDHGNHPGTSWTSYSVTLSESAGWLRHNGNPIADDDTVPASQADIQTVLSDLTQLRIRGEFVVGFDSGDLDNVVLNAD